MPKPLDQKIPRFVDRGKTERGKSFKDALTNRGGVLGKHRGEEDGPRQKVVEVPAETMAFVSLQSKSLVGRASSLKSLTDLHFFINDIGGSDIGVHFLGGLSVLLSFPNRVEEEGCLAAVSECGPQARMSGFGDSSDLGNKKVKRIFFVLGRAHKKKVAVPEPGRPKKRQRKELEDDPFDLNILLGLGPSEKEVGFGEQEVESGSEAVSGGSEGILPVVSFDLNKGVEGDLPGESEDEILGVEMVDGREVLTTDAAVAPSALDKEVDAMVDVDPRRNG
ncbi:hypothetical protein L1987_43695 [Smallanthus sonchifolius]|uniref:Uncharacterized protein n=1 Tax=Smallanthus sonchifolius TaxID=185202 RepID=A0ACB9GNF5_9ASTR|nr:hypothetical protein L1987_43695 [Smallanthus sonchifolius]